MRKMKDPYSSLVHFVKRILKAYILSWILYLLVLGFSPAAFRIWVRWYYDDAHVMPLDAPDNIGEAIEVYGIQDDFHHIETYLNDQNLLSEVVVFRNFTDCDDTFRNVVYPRNQDKVDQFRDITYRNRTGNIYVDGFEATGTYSDKTLKEVLEEESPDYYASFLRLFTDQDFSDFMKAPLGTFFGDTSFISHFKYNLVSTRIHSANVISTFSLQCYGTKRWLFWKEKDLSRHGIYTTANPAGVAIRGTPQSIVKIPTLRVTLNPNDAMYFPPMYAHAVASSKGRNILFSFRKIGPSIILRALRTNFANTIFTFTRNAVHKFYHKRDKGFQLSGEYSPFRDAWFEESQAKQNSAFMAFEGLSPFGFEDE